jgi:hypothetical protein
MLQSELTEIPKRKELASKLDSVVDQDTQKAIRRRLYDYYARAVIFADEGREPDIRRKLRRMHVHNPIPSQYGSWPGGVSTKNIAVERIIEDTVFKRSSDSFFIQLADCVAYALLKRETPPSARIKKYGIDQMFDENLQGVCFKPAAPTDPLGVVRK